LTKKAGNFIIALDDGHGMETAGKRTPYISDLGRQIRENEFNKEVVRHLDIELMRCGFNTFLTAPKDTDTPLKTRVDLANKAQASAFVSIHFNALKSTFELINPEGLEIHIYPSSAEGRKLAGKILYFLYQGTPQKNRGIKESNFYVLRETHMPAILSENGYMDNPKEAMLMIDAAYQKEVAEEHCRGICSYFNVPYVPETNENEWLRNWNKKDMKEFVTKEDLLNFSRSDMEEPIMLQPKTIRKYGSNIHIFETTKNMQVESDLGVREVREKLTKIVKDKLKEGVILGINLGMFSYTSGSEHNTLYISKGLYHNPPSPLTVDFIYYLDGSTEIMNIKEYDKVLLSKLQATTHFAIGTSYSLVQKGKINLECVENFAHANNKEPRTMFGAKADGTFVLVVTDGRTANSAGLTAHEQAELMLSLGCVNAVNVDGGGSSEMVQVKDGAIVVIINQLAAAERDIGSVLLVKTI